MFQIIFDENRHLISRINKHAHTYQKQKLHQLQITVFFAQIFTVLLRYLKFSYCHKANYKLLLEAMRDQSQEYPINTSEPTQKPYIGYVKDKDYYFDGYSHFSIHQEMLKDKVRTQCYMKAIKDNPALFKNKIVLDVGSGTGVLSIFAAKSGAKHVYGIQKANIYQHSRNIIEQNGLSHKITIINGLVEEIELPVEKVDIIISQWMGYFLLYESMFDSVLYAKNKWLRQGGILMPNRAEMFIAALDDRDYYKKKLNFWDSVYGISMKCMKKWVLSQPIVDPINTEDILSGGQVFYEVDLEKVTVQELDYIRDFKLEIFYEGKMHGVVSWFDCYFDHGSKSICLSTSPYKEQTHWKQTVFYFDTPISVKQNDVVQGSIKVQKAKENPRQINVKIDYRVKGIQNVQCYRIA